MTIYRALVALEKGNKIIQAGGFLREHEWSIELINKLVEMGKVSRVSAPPLMQLPGWKLRTKKLERAGIQDADQFLEATNESLSQIMGASIESIEKWKSEVTSLLTIPQPQG